MSTTSIRILCSSCKSVSNVNKLVFKIRRNTGLPYSCEGCGANLYETGGAVKTGKTDSQKRSRKQEKRAAQRIGGRVQPASGAGLHKGDVKAEGHARVECKFTRAKSFNLRLSELQKIEKEASPPEKPIFEIEFQNAHPHKRYAVIPGWLLDHFLSLEEE
jgi:hypothetical protein